MEMVWERVAARLEQKPLTRERKRAQADAARAALAEEIIRTKAAGVS